MRRRDFIAATAGLAAASPAAAAGGPSAGPEAPTLNLAALGLPVIAGDRIRNYVFVNIRLHLAGGADPQAVRALEPYFRDALVRAAHRAPFTLADDWTRLNEVAITRALMAAAPVIVGPEVVQRVEIVSQTAQRRTGVRPV